MSNLAGLGWPLQTWWTGNLRGFHTKRLTLQRYLMKYRVKALFPVRERGAVMALLHVSHQLQDLIRLQDFERQHDFQ